MMKCATAVAILQMFQMYSGGHLVQLPALNRAKSTWLLRAFFQPKDGFLTVLSKLLQCSIISQTKSENSKEAKIISCLQSSIFVGFVLKQPFSLFSYAFVTWWMSDPLFSAILIHIFKKWKAGKSRKKCIGRKFQCLSFKYFPIWAELEDITSCFWRNPLWFEDVRV